MNSQQGILKSAFSKFTISVEKNWKGMLLMFLSAITTAVAQFIWKISGSDNLLWIILGIGLYGFSSVLMILAFRLGSLSVIHPVMSLSYGIGIILSAAFLAEIIPPVRIVGVFVITLGVIFIGGGDA